MASSPKAIRLVITLSPPPPGAPPRIEASFISEATLADVVASLARSGSLGPSCDAEYLAATCFDGVTVVYVRSAIRGRDLSNVTLSGLGLGKAGSSSAGLRLSLPLTVFTLKSTGLAIASTTATESEPKIALTSMQEEVEKVTSSSSAACAVSPDLPDSAMVIDDPATRGGMTLPEAKRQRVEEEDGGIAPACPAEAVLAAPSVGRGRLELRAASEHARRAIARLRASVFDADAKVALSTLLVILDNVVREPGNQRLRSLRLANPRFHEAVGRHPAAVDVLRAAGFAEDQALSQRAEAAGVVVASSGGYSGGGDAVLELSSSVEDDQVTSIVREAVAGELQTLGERPPPPPAIDYSAGGATSRAAALAAAAAAAEAAAAATFDPFRATFVKPGSDGGGGSAGPAAGFSSEDSSTERELRAMRDHTVALQRANRPPADRQTRIWLHVPAPATAAVAGTVAGTAAGSSHAGAGASMASDAVSSSAVVDDDMPDAEAQALLLAYARKKLTEASTDAPLRTAALRELEAARSARVFTSAAIRVQLPDRTTLSGVFSPLDSLADVHAWVRGLLAPAAAARPHFLFSAPPPLAYADDPSTTLAAARLVPSKLLYFAFGEGLGRRAAGAAATDSDTASLLSADALAIAATTAAGSAQPSPPPAPFSPPPQPAPVDDAALDEMANALLSGELSDRALLAHAGTPATNAGMTAATHKPAGRKPAWMKI